MHHKPCYSKEPKAHEAGLGLGDFLSGKKKFKATLCFNLMWLYDDEKKHLQLKSEQHQVLPQPTFPLPIAHTALQPWAVLGAASLCCV